MSMKSMAEWLSESDRRYIVIRRGVAGAGENRPGFVRFDVTSKVPDGRKVVSSVEINYDLLDTADVDVGSMIISQAETAIACLLAKEKA